MATQTINGESQNSIASNLVADNIGVRSITSTKTLEKTDSAVVHRVKPPASIKRAYSTLNSDYETDNDQKQAATSARMDFETGVRRLDSTGLPLQIKVETRSPTTSIDRGMV